MKTHRTTTLDTSPQFRDRFTGAHQEAKKAAKNLALGFNRSTQHGKWTHALYLWNRIKSGLIAGASADAVRAEHAGKFAQFDKNGGRLPLGV